MDVRNLAAELFIGADIAIKAPAGLSEARRAALAPDRVQPARLLACPARYDPLGDRELHPQQRTVQRDGLRTNEQVDVLGHDDPGEQMEPVEFARSDHRSRKVVSDFRIVQERKAAIAGERDEPRIAADLAASHPLSMRMTFHLFVRSAHATSLPRAGHSTCAPPVSSRTVHVPPRNRCSDRFLGALAARHTTHYTHIRYTSARPVTPRTPRPTLLGYMSIGRAFAATKAIRMAKPHASRNWPKPRFLDGDEDLLPLTRKHSWRE